MKPNLLKPIPKTFQPRGILTALAAISIGCAADGAPAGRSAAAATDAGATIDRPNFLFIAIDDLNDFSGFAAEEPGNFLQVIYPDPVVRKEVVERLTPNLDRLASRSAPFLRAYCPSALCGPSRTSLMTGVAPHASGYYMHDRHFRTYNSLQDAITLPQQLKAHGYFTAGAGKIFHRAIGDAAGPLADDWADARNSWSTWVNHPQGAAGKPGRYAPPKGGNMQFGIGTEPLQDTGDWQTADFIARVLENGAARAYASRNNPGPDRIELPTDQPFFLAAGVFRPHLPFYAPPEYFERFPVAEMTGLDRAALDAIVADLEDLPSGAKRFTDYESGKFRDIMDHAATLEETDADIAAWRSMVQAYLACVALADACIGRLLDGLENSSYRDNTVIAVWSDHGFHLGPKFHVAKQAVWEKANRSVLVLHDPRIPGGSDGRPRRQLATLNDLYPTICDLAGVPLPGPNRGRSLVPLIVDAGAPPLRDAFVFTYMEGNHGLRTEQHAYLRYRDGSQELYDMTADPDQIVNLATDSRHAGLVRSLDQQLEHWLAETE
jgi:arylsulfatase A-like enzyme